MERNDFDNCEKSKQNHLHFLAYSTYKNCDAEKIRFNKNERVSAYRNVSIDTSMEGF